MTSSRLRLRSGTFVCGALLAAFVGAARSQERPASPSIDELIGAVKQGRFNPAILNKLVQARARQAVPALEQQFAASSDVVTKQTLASALIRLGDTQPVYWTFLADRATAAIKSDAPFSGVFDAQGQTVPRQRSPEFLAWAAAHHISAEAASEDQVYALPRDVLLLAVTGDPRGLPLLRLGLSSPNYFIQAVSSKGLAKLRDKDSVPLVIAACRKAPAEAAALIAQALPFFEDPRALTAARTFIAERELVDELQRLSREKGPDVLF